MKPLTRHVALVTGASGGIGQAIARGLAAEGAAVALGFGEHSEPAEKLAEEIVDGGGLAVAIAADLSRREGADELVDAVESQLGAVEVLVAAAGSGKRQNLEDVSLDDFDEMMAVNLRAPFRLAQRRSTPWRRN
jgi:NAD(P)-dependent dehydrogenase (short-subunit alcohol dehydrogenase family)